MPTSPQLDSDLADRAALVGEAALGRGLLVATAESLTSGLVAVHLGAAPQSADWFTGGVVAYTVDAKQRGLDVPPGPVISRQCATSMADGAARLLAADVAVGTTGVGGPDEQEGQPVGTVFIGVHTREGTTCTEHRFDGDPQEILHAVTAEALDQLHRAITGPGG